MPHSRWRGGVPDRGTPGRAGRRDRPHAASLRRDRAGASVGADRSRIPGLLGGRRGAAAGVAHLRRLRGLLLEQRDRTDAMVAAIDRELEARAKGMKMTPEEQLEMFGPRLYDAIGGCLLYTSPSPR